MPNLLKVRVSLKGRPIRSFTFNKKTVSIGRDPGSDIFLDNTGISRSHAKIDRTPGGYMVEDLGSANGTFLNDKQIQRDYLGHDDVVRIGKFALWIGVESDRREANLLGKSPGPGVFEGTMVLSPDQLLDMQERSKQEELDATETPAGARAPVAARPAGPSRSVLILAIGGVFVLGMIVGAVVSQLAAG